MRKKYVLGSVIVALLMLVGTQIIFVNDVKSDPTQHTGIAYAGSLWVDELNVSSVLRSVKYVGITHANATEDWVYWQNGRGNFSVNWSVGVSNRHPEYYVVYTFSLINVDNNCTEIGNKTHSQTVQANSSSVSGGALTIPYQFNSSEQRQGHQKIVCMLGAFLQINNTREARNFSSFASDRCIVLVSFPGVQIPRSFSYYRNESNWEFPRMWSWINGWQNHYNNASEMLEKQTFFLVGSNEFSASQNPNGLWKMGNFTFEVTRLGLLRFPKWTPMNLSVNWSVANGIIQGPVAIYYGITDIWGNHHGSIVMRAILIGKKRVVYMGSGKKEWNFGDNPTGRFLFNIACVPADEDPNGNVQVGGWVYATHVNPIWVNLNWYGYYIHVVQNGNQGAAGGGTAYYWKDNCAYLNMTSQSLSVSSSMMFGITTVSANIDYALQHNDQSIYSFKGDRGDTQIKFIC
jgi:hypothetical protein